MDELIDKNILIIKNISNETFKFKKLITKRNSIILYNCSNLKINIGSTINKLVLNNCQNIKIKLKKTISGIEIDKSSNIVIKTKKNEPLNYIELNKSNLKLYIKKLDLNKLTIESTKSKINYKLF